MYPTAKSSHTKAGNKIRRYIAGGIPPTDLITLRQELKLIAQEVLVHHETWYHSFKDSADAKISAMEWLSKFEDAHLELTTEIQIYLDPTGASAPEDPTTQVTSQSLAKDKAELIEFLENMKTLFGEFSAQLKSSAGLNKKTLLPFTPENSVAQKRRCYSRRGGRYLICFWLIPTGSNEKVVCFFFLPYRFQCTHRIKMEQEMFHRFVAVL